MKKANIAVIGATGLVGITLLKVLEERLFPVNNLYLFASNKSKGEEVIFKGKKYYVQELNEKSFNHEIDLAFFAIEPFLSKKYAPLANKHGIIVIDNSSAFRLDEEVPLIVPEVNGYLVKKEHFLIANPNCSTIQSVIPLNIIKQKYGLKKVIYNTYQSVSGSGYLGIYDLTQGIMGEEPKYYQKPIASNVLPHIDDFLDNGYTKEEMKMVNETRKILNLPHLAITATCVRVPVFKGHAVTVNVECEKKVDLEELIQEFKKEKSLVVFTDDYPTPRDAADTDYVYVGRIRKDLSSDSEISFWVVADNVRKGAATNAIQIGEIIWKEIQNVI